MYYPEINKWIIPISAVRVSLDELAHDGNHGNEGICLWLGNRGEEGLAIVSHCVLLRGEYIKKSPMNITIQPELLREVHEKAQEHDLTLLGQIHSHAIIAGVDLSWVDKKYGVSAPGYLSVVAPGYALTPGTTLMECGIHVFMPRKGYVRLSDGEVRNRVLLEKSATCSTFTIG